MRTGKVVYHGTLTDLRAMAPETEFVMHTARAGDALAVARQVAEVHDPRVDGDTLRFTARDETVESLSIAWGQAGIGARLLAPARAPLETLFFRLTGAESDSDFDRRQEVSA